MFNLARWTSDRAMRSGLDAGRGHCVVFFIKNCESHFTNTVLPPSLSTQEYKLVPAGELSGKPVVKQMLGVTTVMDSLASHPRVVAMHSRSRFMPVKSPLAYRHTLN